ncbi:ricin B lectin domain-containing protein [Phanerochaete sordida]|uniref:Ricin B lectin domain-containing protein n=1 Tax=Phanerochaete sordida TaxID=48140 RepID=A0A9P3GME2_9APHY|nr:ricin B lectin domain-containing protein [Phanerochaete sordida]
MASEHLQSGVYFIQNFYTGTVLDLAGASPANGTKIQGYTKRELSELGVPAQLWIISLVAGEENVYTVQNTSSRSFMDMAHGDAADGTPVIGHEYNGGQNQKWRITRHGNYMSYVIQNVATRTYADMANGSKANGTPVVGWSGSGSHNQLWLIARA